MFVLQFNGRTQMFLTWIISIVLLNFSFNYILLLCIYLVFLSLIPKFMRMIFIEHLILKNNFARDVSVYYIVIKCHNRSFEYSIFVEKYLFIYITIIEGSRKDS